MNLFLLPALVGMQLEEIHDIRKQADNHHYAKK
jgi:hypothetical protein